MKIALLGYGKMGHMVEEAALERGHDVVLRIDADSRRVLTAEILRNAGIEAAIEFSTPTAVVDNIYLCLEAGVPIIVGTTGWNERLEEVAHQVFAEDGTLVYASNFSVGVNLMFALNEQLAKWMERYPEYRVKVEEVHHTQKLDAPSGTALSLVKGILDNSNMLTGWDLYAKGQESEPEKDRLPVIYSREDGIPGIHEVSYTSDIDKLYIGHTAFSRKGFALGAVLAAEFTQGRKGIFTAKDIFQF